MLIRKRQPFELPYSEWTSKTLYRNRREFLASAGMAAAALAGAKLIGDMTDPDLVAHAGTKLDAKKSDLSVTNETITRQKDATTYNNFYEFGTDKSDPSQNAGNFHPTTWTVKVAGLCEKPRNF